MMLEQFSWKLLFLVCVVYTTGLQTGNKGCLKTELPCDNGECIPRNGWCNSTQECSDKSDEYYCATSYFWNAKCKDIHFKCVGGKCFPSSVVCDGYRDCDFNEDEERCDDENVTTAESTTQRTRVTITSPSENTSTSNTTKDDSYEMKFMNDHYITTRTEYVRRTTTEPTRRTPPRLETLVPWNYEHGDGDEVLPKFDLDEGFPNRFSRQVLRAREWIMMQRDGKYGWDEKTARALVALALTGTNFENGGEEELMRKHFRTLLATKLNGKKFEEISPTRLALNINALLATCQSPRNFYGYNLVETLRRKVSAAAFRAKIYINPAVFLTVCLAGEHLNSNEISMLSRTLIQQNGGQTYEDMRMLAISAAVCLSNVNNGKRYDSNTIEAIELMLSRMNSTGSFGSEYSTALAAKALFSSSGSKWDYKDTLNFLLNYQDEDGSFGDFLATYHILPVLVGKSLLHLRNIGCQKMWIDPPVTTTETLSPHPVRYSLYFDYSLERQNLSVILLVPKHSTVLQIMEIAERQNCEFRFYYERENGQVKVYSISDLPNDIIRGFYWHLYITQEAAQQYYGINYKHFRLSTEDIERHVPSTNDHIIYWYHPVTI